MTNEFEDCQAVLHALKTAADHATVGKSVSSARLFEALPRCLRQRWSLRYLRDVVLREMISEELIEIQQVGPGELNYRPTRKGEQFVLLTAPDEEELSAA